MDSPWTTNDRESGLRAERRATALACGALLLSVAAMAFCHSSDGDLGFHLATGREVLAHGRIPATNVLSFTNPSYPWLLQQWLPATLFELAWRAGGIDAVLGLKLVLVVASFGFAFAAARAFGADPLVAGFVCLLAAAGCAFRFEARPLLFTELSLSALMFCFARYSASAAHDQRIPRKPLLAAAALAFVCCHLHAGAVFLFLAMLAIACGCWLEPLRARLASAPALEPHGARHARAWFLAAFASLLCAAFALQLYHPAGARVLLVPFDMASDAYLGEHLIEFRPPTRFPVSYLLGFWCFLVLALAVVFARARRLHAAHGFLLCGFALLALRHTRLVFEFALVAAPLLAAALSPLATGLRARRGAWSTLLLLSALLAPLDNWHKLEPGFGFSPNTWPLAHFERMRTLGLRGHVFASDAWAGPMLGFFYPVQRAFFDNRFDAYPRAFFRDAYQATRYGKPGWDRTLDRYAIEVVLMRYTSDGERRFQHDADNLRQKLAADSRYALVFFDDYGELFVRAAGANRAQAAAHAITGVDPDRGRFLERPRKSAPTLARALEAGPRSVRLLTLTAAALADAGERATARGLLAEAKARAPLR